MIVTRSVMIVARAVMIVTHRPFFRHPRRSAGLRRLMLLTPTCALPVPFLFC
jgi:hypothetical protein